MSHHRPQRKTGASGVQDRSEPGPSQIHGAFVQLQKELPSKGAFVQCRLCSAPTRNGEPWSKYQADDGPFEEVQSLWHVTSAATWKDPEDI